MGSAGCGVASVSLRSHECVKAGWIGHVYPVGDVVGGFDPSSVLRLSGMPNRLEATSFLRRA